MPKYRLLVLSVFFLAFGTLLKAQEETPFIAYDVPSQNLLKFNRYLLNPTFSTVREDKSYINLFHRNQSVSFDDNFQTYFLSYSGRIGDRSGVGASLYTQREGLIDNFGLLANYAYGIKLSDKSNFTFGGNFSYYNSGFNESRANPVDDDPVLNGLDDSALITFQPGFNLSYGNLDFGVMADNLFDYNLKTNESITDFNEKTFTGHLQYTHQFKNTSGILESGRIMPLARARTIAGEDVSLGGSLILDLPKIGWLQAGYDDTYGAAAGLGFNLNKRLSIGYTVEKGLSSNFDNFGVNHEISLAYSFNPNLTEDRVLLEKDNEQLASNEEEEVPVEELTLTEKDLKIAELEAKIAENNAILDELLFRQDSLERTRQSDLERRFNTVMQIVRRETKGNRPDIEERAKKIFSDDSPSSTLVDNTPTPEDIRRDNTNSDVSDTPTGNSDIVYEDTYEVTETDDVSQKPFITTKKVDLKPKGHTDAVVLENTKKDKTYTQTASKRRTTPNKYTIPDVQSGHYLIANVYRGEKYMHPFLDSLAKQGLEANYFINPRNGMYYVYLENYDSQSQALAAHKSQLDGSYSGNTWVMRVQGTVETTDLAENTYEYDDNALQQNVVKNPTEGEETQAPRMETFTSDGIGSGFYIIANVFANPKNANRFVKELNSQGLSASYFINPENQFRYVYLKKHRDWTTALTTYYSKVDNAYFDPIWIMRVKPYQEMA